MTSTSWLVPVTTLRRSIGSTREEVRTGRVGELRVADSVVPADADARAEARLSSVDGGVEVAALVAAPWHGQCRRCLEPISGEIRCSVREMYRPRRPGESDDADEDTYPLRGEQLDLQPLVRDALLLELPMAPLCRDLCLGLCPVCGANLNDDPCDCGQARADPRWASLDPLKRRCPDAGPTPDA